MQTENQSKEVQIAKLREQRANVVFNYENSAWGSGPAHREQLDKIDLKIAELSRAQ